MKGAAAALAGAVLFFVGVLTATGDGNRVPPPPAIPLGESPAAESPGTAPGGTGSEPVEPPPPGSVPAGPEATGPDAPAPPAGSETPPGPETPPAGGSGGVEEVTGQVDCVEVGGGRGAGSCPPGQAKKAGDPPRDRREDGDG